MYIKYVIRAMGTQCSKTCLKLTKWMLDEYKSTHMETPTSGTRALRQARFTQTYINHLKDEIPFPFNFQYHFQGPRHHHPLRQMTRLAKQSHRWAVLFFYPTLKHDWENMVTYNMFILTQQVMMVLLSFQHVCQASSRLFNQKTMICQLALGRPTQTDTTEAELCDMRVRSGSGQADLGRVR